MDARILKHGAPARLFPVYPESCKEQKSLSIVLASMVSVRPFAEQMLSHLGIKVGKRTTVSCFTEVTLTNEIKGLKDRPDGLIVIESAGRSWSALVEAKIGKNKVESDQLERYLELARANKVDAVITVTNELTPAPTLHPTSVNKSFLKYVSLFHFSWASILTTAFLLAAAKKSPFENDDEAYIISELIRYLEHPNSGRIPLDQMNQDWPKIVANVQAGHPVNSKAPEIQEMISAWHQESRDVALSMTRKLKEPVLLAITRSKLADRDDWVESEIKQFSDSKVLSFELDIPNAASKISVESDFLRRAIRASMKLQAPGDKASNGAKLNWLLRQLGKAELSRIIIRCITRGKGQNFGAMAHELDPKSEEIKRLAEIVSFQVEMSADLGAKFNSRKKFIEELEGLVPEFYENVGQHLQAWIAPPPKMNKEKRESSAEDASSQADDDPLDEQASPSAKPAPVVEVPIRPSWAKVWQEDLPPQERPQDD